jgi:signal peptidase I
MLRDLSLGLLALVAAAIFAVRFAVPMALGIQVVTIETGSMAPTMPVGTMAYVQHQEDYQVGDPVTYVLDHQTITHRIVVDMGGGFYRVQGDANPGEDAQAISRGMILGKVVWSVPAMGTVTKVLSQPVVMLFVLLVAMTILVVPGLIRGQAGGRAPAQV